MPISAVRHEKTPHLARFASGDWMSNPSCVRVASGKRAISHKSHTHATLSDTPRVASFKSLVVFRLWGQPACILMFRLEQFFVAARDPFVTQDDNSSVSYADVPAFSCPAFICTFSAVENSFSLRDRVVQMHYGLPLTGDFPLQMVSLLTIRFTLPSEFGGRY